MYSVKVGQYLLKVRKKETEDKCIIQIKLLSSDAASSFWQLFFTFVTVGFIKVMLFFFFLVCKCSF